MPIVPLSIVLLAAVQAGPSLQVGEIIQNGGDQQMKVLACRPTAYRWRECQTVLWKNGAPDSNPAWWNEDDLIKGDARVRTALGIKPRGAAASAAPVRTQPAQAARPVARPPVAAGGRIPNGTYDCKLWMGNSYVSLGTVTSVKGSLNTNLLAKVGATFTGATPTATGVTINYKTARGYNESMDCTRK